MECLEVTLSFTLNKNLAIISGFLIALTTWVYLEHQAMTSKFNQDMGNGVVIYADKYVESGDWVFDCNYSRLISRSPLPPPLDHLKQEARPKPTSTYSLSPSDRATANEIIQKLTKESNWHSNLRYVFSTVSENSKLSQHLFNTTTEHENRTWVIYLFQAIENEEWSRFYIAAAPYAPETFIDYEKAMQQARASCPTPQ